MIDITIDQQSISKCLSYLKSTVGNNTQIGEDCISMQYDSALGVLILETNNSVEFSQVKVVCSSTNNTSGAAPFVEFKRLSGIVSSIPSSNNISMKEVNGNLEITACGRSMTLQGRSVTPLQMPSVTGTSWLIPTEKLNMAMKCSNTITSDKQAAFTNPIYGCVRIETISTRAEVSKLDYMTKRMFTMTLDTTSPNVNGVALIESTKYSKIESMFEDALDLNIVMDGSNVQICRGTSVQTPVNSNITEAKYICRRLNGNYPHNIGTSLNKGGINPFKFSVEDLEGIVKSMEAIEDSSSANATDSVVMDIVDDTMNLRYSTLHGTVEGCVISSGKTKGNIKENFRLKDIKDVLSSAKITGATEMSIGTLAGHPNYFVIRHEGIPATQGEILPTYSISTITKSTP